MSEVLPDMRVHCDETRLYIGFEKPVWVLSSAPYNGGLTRARHIVNLRVDENHDGKRTGFSNPEADLAEYCRGQAWHGPAVGMMTAAPMSSFRRAASDEGGVTVAALVTSGLTNARRAGDPAECRDPGELAPPPGTINIVVVTNAALTDAAMVEALTTITEAKAGLLQDLGITSPISGLTATGTGTDCAAVIRGDGPPIRYCGKHVFVGEMMAKTVTRALKSSLEPKPGT